MKQIARQRNPFNYPSRFENNNGNVEIFYDDEKLTAIGYLGKRNKHAFHIRYKTKERMHQAMQSFYDNAIKSFNTKVERKAAQKIAQSNLKADDHFKIGDIIVNSWGYEQTNIEFYQVTAVKNKVITVHELKKDYRETQFMAGNSIPLEGQFNETKKPFDLKLKAYGNSEVRICNPQSFYYFHKWDGRPEYESHYN